MRSLIGRIVDKAPVPYVGQASGRRSMFGGGSTATGMSAQLRAYGTVSTLFSIVSKTASKTAAVEWKLYRKAASGLTEDRVEVTSHAALDLFRTPNPFMTQQELVESVQQHIDLTGEGWIVVASDPRMKRVPLELWPVRPDRMTPVTDPDKFLLGYMYTGPTGEEVALSLDQVIQIRMPNPEDPYRGMGPVQTLLTDLESSRYAAEWNRNFFKNSAEPGGIIEVEKRLSDDEFNELAARWNEQHRGVANAHRVAIIEQGVWKDRSYSMRDMQFTELRHLSRDVIMEAFGVHKIALGISEDVNRASATAGKALFAEDLTVPRADRWKGALNNDLLKLFGDTARDLEWDYTSPVPADAEADNAARDSKVAAVVALVTAGAEPAPTLKAFDLPDLPWRAPAPASEQTPPNPAVDASWSRIVAGLVRNAAETGDTPPDVDLSALDAAWSASLAALLAQWASVVADWITQLLAQITSIFESGSRTDLSGLKIATATATGVLQTAQLLLGETAARQVVAEAATQDVDLRAVYPARDDYAENATLTVDLLARGFETSAAREAQRRAGPDPDVTAVVEGVREYLESITDAEPKRQLGGALHGAVNAGRFATFSAGPLGSLYATEVLDSATCLPCKEIDGRWICNTDDLTALYRLYPLTGYVDCLGRDRCRGTVTGSWRPQTAESGGSR